MKIIVFYSSTMNVIIGHPLQSGFSRLQDQIFLNFQLFVGYFILQSQLLFTEDDRIPHLKLII